MSFSFFLFVALSITTLIQSKCEERKWGIQGNVMQRFIINLFFLQVSISSFNRAVARTDGFKSKRVFKYRIDQTESCHNTKETSNETD